MIWNRDKSRLQTAGAEELNPVISRHRDNPRSLIPPPNTQSNSVHLFLPTSLPCFCKFQTASISVEAKGDHCYYADWCCHERPLQTHFNIPSVPIVPRLSNRANPLPPSSTAPAHRTAQIWHEIIQQSKAKRSCNMVLRVREPSWASEMSPLFTSPTHHHLTSGFTTLTPTLLCTLQPTRGAWRDDFYKLMLSECEMRTAGHGELHMAHSMCVCWGTRQGLGLLCEHLQRCCSTVQEQGVMLHTPGLQFFPQFTSTTHLQVKDKPFPVFPGHVHAFVYLRNNSRVKCSFH